MAIKHAFVSEKEDGEDASLVRPSNWNAEHIGLITVRKTADQIVNNNKDLQNDDHLVFAVAAGQIWVIQLVLLLQQDNAAADWKYGWAYPNGTTILWGSVSHAWCAGATNDLWTQIETLEDTNTLTTITGLLITAVVIVGATAGNIQFQWCQRTATVANNTMKAHSSIIALCVG